MLGERLREFEDKSCQEFSTRETEREAQARVRRTAKSSPRAQNCSSSHPTQSYPTTDVPTITTPSAGSTSLPTSSRSSDSARQGLANSGKHTSVTRLPKTFSLNTPKVHFLGDYVDTIASVGTTDGYSTQQVIFDILQPNLSMPLIIPRHNSSRPPINSPSPRPCVLRGEAWNDKWRTRSGGRLLWTDLIANFGVPRAQQEKIPNHKTLAFGWTLKNRTISVRRGSSAFTYGNLGRDTLMIQRARFVYSCAERRISTNQRRLQSYL